MKMIIKRVIVLSAGIGYNGMNRGFLMNMKGYYLGLS